MMAEERMEYNSIIEREYSSAYKKIREKAEAWPDWKKEIYNSSYAVSIHSRKLTIKIK